MDLKKALAEFERPELEFKASLPDRSDLAKTLCAFANGRGGRLILGVEERDHTRKVVGLQEPEFREVGRFFRVTLKVDTLTRPLITVKPAMPLGADEAKIIDYLREHGQITTKVATRLIGRVRSNARKKLKKLETSGLILWHGKNRTDPTGYYMLKNEDSSEDSSEDSNEDSRGQ